MTTRHPAALVRPERVRLDEKIAWSIDDAAAAASVSRTTIKQLISRGVLKPSRVTGRPLLDPRQVRAALFGDQAI